MGIDNQTKHQLRDSNLIFERQQLKTKIENDLTKDNRVLGIFYGGSIARKNEDLYSDIDLRVIVTDESFDFFIAHKTERPKNWGKILFIEDGRPNTPYTVTHFKNFVKVDTFYYHLNDLHPSIYLKEETEIVYDPFNYIKDLKLKSEDKRYELKIEAYEYWRNKFFAYLHEGYRSVMRNEIYYALQCIDWLRWSIVTGWYMENDYLPNEYGSWSKYEGERTKLEDWQLNLLVSWDCNREPSSIIKTYKLITLEFVPLHERLCKKLGIDDNKKWINEIIEMVL